MLITIIYYYIFYLLFNMRKIDGKIVIIYRVTIFLM